MGLSLLMLPVMPNMLRSMHIPLNSKPMRQFLPEYSHKYTWCITLSCLSSFSTIYFFNNCSSSLRWSFSLFLLSIYCFLKFSSFSLFTLSSIIFAYLWSIFICLMKYWYLFCTIFAFYSIYLSFGSISNALPPWILSIYYRSNLCNFYWWLSPYTSG